MANLLEVAQLIYNQINPNPSDENAVQFEEVAASVRIQYPLEQYYYLRQQRKDDWWFALPSHLLSESDDLDVVDNEIDISELKILKAMSGEAWLVNIGGLACKCKYIKSTVNQTQLLCGDDSLPDDSKTYYVIGKKIRLPQGAHAKKLKIIYANDGSSLDESQEIDDIVAGIVRVKVLEMYQGKTSKEDETNNSNSTT